jgi:transposase-like protein
VQNLLERDLRVTEKTLFIIDGGKGIRRALQDVFGDNAVEQRCQVHKIRNVRDHLPEERRRYVTKQMNEAYRSTNAKVAKKRLLQTEWRSAETPLSGQSRPMQTEPIQVEGLIVNKGILTCQIP